MLRFEHFTVEQGLPSNVVPTLFQDRTGYLWLGTFYGVARYDGYSFVSYINREGDSTSITNSIVNAICDDSDGNIWFGHSRGVDKFNPSTEIFTHYILNPEKPVEDWSNHVLSLLEDKNGTLWIGTGSGLYFFNKAKKIFRLIQHNPKDPHSISSNSVNAIYQDRNGTLWFGTGRGLNKYDVVSKSFTRYLFPPDYPYGILSIYQDAGGILWLGTGCGVVKYYPETGKYILYENEPGNKKSLANNIVLSICEDRSGQLWISTKKGVDIFDKNSETFTHNMHDDQKPGRINSNDIGKIIFDLSGVIWISTYDGGINKYTPPNPAIRYYSPDDGISTMFPIVDIMENKNGKLWIGTDRGILKFDPEIGSFERFAADKNVYLLLVDAQGSIWFSARNENLCKIDQSGNITRFRDPSGAEFPGWVSAMCNSSDGNIWVGTGNGGVYTLDPVSGKFDILYQSTHWIETVYEDTKGFFWIGTQESGIVLYDPSQKKFSYYSHIPEDTLSLSSNSITHIREDQEGNIFIVTGHTLNRFNRNAGRFERFGGKNGFPDNIFNVVFDKKNNLWISIIGKGTVKYDWQNNQFSKYFYWRGLGYLAKSEKLYYHTREGLICFHPDSLKNNPLLPPVVFTSIRVFEKPVPIRKLIQLSYNENFISFEFAALNFIEPESNLYAYKMEGVDKEWVNSGTRRFASYPNLDPGTYIFRLKGSNNDGVWNKQAASITIIISPPFWKTWWAYLIYFVVLMISLWGIRRYELNRISYKNQVEIDRAILNEKAETEKIKSRFFANISHEFRTPLTLILGPAEKIISNTSEDVVKDAGIIRRNSRRLLQLVNQLLDLSRLEAGKLKLEASVGNIVSFVKGAALSFESLAESKDITLQIIPEKDFIELYFDKDKMMKILINLLSNAFKFTPEEGIISVSIREIKGVGNIKDVEIKIRDTGIGIPSVEIPKLFDRFYQVDSSFTKEHEGTGIGLALTKELVELHHGKISAESLTGTENTNWTEFTITLPSGNSHLKNEAIIMFEETDVNTISLPEISITGFPPQNNLPIIKEQMQEKPILLIVEDNYDMRQYIKGSLDNKYLIEEAVNGEQGLRKAEKTIPDLIISDMMMPKMDGNELTRILKSNEKTSHIPVILLTARSGHENKLAGLETGADDYLTKPFDLRELHVRIENLIKIRRKLQEKFRKLENVLNISGGKGISLDEQFIIKVMDVIDKHISDENFSIEEFGSEVGMSRTQFHRKIRAVTGKPASMFLRSVRLARAKKMIEEQRGNISEIAYSVGFSSPSYFTKCYREEFGHSPTKSTL
jgi:signal transduction histidine kinase/ligand-binding sensor domain-containing protein/DNA-binding response OmpR family regulator